MEKNVNRNFQSHNIRLWSFNEPVEINADFHEPIEKLANIGNHVFLLTQNNSLYEGLVQTNSEGKKFLELYHADLKAVDIASTKDNLFIVDLQGRVLICNEQLEVLKEVSLVEEVKCLRGHYEVKQQLKVKKIAVSEYGRLYISEDNQLWGSGYMPQVAVNSEVPKKIHFFSGRTIHDVCVGTDFALVVASKQLQPISEDVNTSNCLKCISSSSLSQLNLPEDKAVDICPLGVKVLSESSLEDDNVLTNGDKINLNGLLEENNDKNKVGKNIIFRNTEAAKDFLTRQISRMSSVGEEYLLECTEKPTRLIKENMSNVATFVYEGVKTVGDKVATLSRHVSANSDCNSGSNYEQISSRKNSKEDFMWSGSQSTSERDLSEMDIQEHVEDILNEGKRLINREVWSWGNIYQGLLGINNELKKELPVILSSLSNAGVQKISLTNRHACALTLDGRLFIWGQNSHHQVTLDNNVDQAAPKPFQSNIKERVRDAACAAHFTVILSNKSNLTYFGRGAAAHQVVYNKFLSEQENTGAVGLFKNLASAQQYVGLNRAPQWDEFLNDFLYKQQITLEEMLAVHQQAIKVLMKKTGDASHSFLYESLCKSYADLMYFLSVNVKELLKCRNGLVSTEHLSLIRCFNEYTSTHRNYVDLVYNVASINGFDHMSKLVAPSLYNLKTGVLKEKVGDLALIFLSPCKRLPDYSQFFRRYASQHLQAKWKDFLDYYDTKSKEADRTRHFWLNAGKNIDFLAAPNRRLVCDSLSDHLNVHNCSRFSSHRLVLFTDVFAHVNGSSTQLHALSLVWLELPHHDASAAHLISLHMPEETLILAAPDGVFKNKWYHALQHAIKSALNKTDLHQPPLARGGTYTFTKAGFFKDAAYTGRWLDAKMHGAGRLRWADGRNYTGQFCHNVLNGYGAMEVPNIGVYEGQWKDSKQNGYGTFTYANKDIYKGYFKDGAPHGHGLLRKGNFTARSASLYIGEWTSGRKRGYGVLDDISIGEKYIGSWTDDKRQGNGLIVTADGVYYEGNFHNDLLSGRGLMVLEDGTHYEGEFKGTGVTSGRGTLTLPTGHVIEGQLTGTVDEGIKIASGTFRKGSEATKSPLPESFGKLCTPPSQKWNALFRHCYQVLGMSESGGGGGVANCARIWQNVAVCLANASAVKRGKGDDYVFHNSLNHLDVIPPFGRDQISLEAYVEIKTYLNRAFDSNLHPLGSLMDSLSEAYAASYNGKIHHILVNHAILEIIDLTQRVYEIIRHLFPALPPCDSECFVGNFRDEIVSFQSLLYPVILPRVYNCLSTLLTLKNESQEKPYKKALIEWNKLTDGGLMSVLSVDRKFFTLEQSDAFAEAIETLQQLKSMFLPIEKLEVIRNAVEKMTPVAHALLGPSYVWNMDDLFPLFLYVVVRARIPDLGAELEFIENFMDPSLENGELGIMFTTLKACYQQILQDKSIQ